MHRLGPALLLVAAAVACEPSKSTTSPEPAPADAAAAPASAQPAAEVEPEAEPEPEPESESEPEVTEVGEAVFSKDGFEARDLHCSLNEPTRHAARYIAAGLVDADAALDACAPKGAAIEVEWSYLSGQAGDISVVAERSKVANCVAAAMSKVRAGVQANCKAVLLIGDTAAATAAYEAR